MSCIRIHSISSIQYQTSNYQSLISIPHLIPDKIHVDYLPSSNSQSPPIKGRIMPKSKREFLKAYEWAQFDRITSDQQQGLPRPEIGTTSARHGRETIRLILPTAPLAEVQRRGSGPPPLRPDPGIPTAEPRGIATQPRPDRQAVVHRGKKTRPKHRTVALPGSRITKPKAARL